MISFWFAWTLGIVLAVVWASRWIDSKLGYPPVDLLAPEWEQDLGGSAPRVSILVPAKNEEEHIEAALTSILRLDYPNYEVLVIDDRSTDRTGEIMERVATQHASAKLSNPQLRVLHITELPQGWLGKTHALWRAVQQASGEWLLFTDADIVFRPDCLRRAMLYAAQSGADHVTLFPTMIMESVGERMMLSFFNTLFYFRSRPWRVADPRSREHLGIGAFGLVRRTVYDAVGTHAAIALEVVDDIKFGKLVKDGGFASRVTKGRDLIRLRWGRGIRGILNNLMKNLFAIMLFRWPLAVMAAVFGGIVNVAPYAGLIAASGWARLPYGIAVASLAAIYRDVSRHTQLSVWYFLLHPIASVLFSYAILRSTWIAMRAGGINWRGTRYSLRELRKE
jgi:glycosyltransferase involved in cell wall biosynthesis